MKHQTINSICIFSLFLLVVLIGWICVWRFERIEQLTNNRITDYSNEIVEENNGGAVPVVSDEEDPWADLDPDLLQTPTEAGFHLVEGNFYYIKPYDTHQLRLMKIIKINDDTVLAKFVFKNNDEYKVDDDIFEADKCRIYSNFDLDKNPDFEE